MEGVDGSEKAGRQLQSESELISRRWEAEVRRELPAARDKSQFALIDALPVIVAELAHWLMAGQPGVREPGALGEHGEHRAGLEGYGIRQVLQEYEILRRVVLSQLEEEGLLSWRVEAVVTEVVLAFMREAATAFVDQKEEAVRKATEETDKEKRLYDAIADTIEEQVFVADRELRHLFVNKSAARLFRRPASEVIGRTARELGISGALLDGLEPALNRALAGENVRGELDAPMPDGSRRSEYLLRPIQDERGQVVGLVGTVHDVHERAMLVDQLRAERLRRGQIAAAVVHDLQSPLAAAKASAEVLLRGEPRNEREHRAVTRILNTIDRVSRMVKDLLDAMHIEANQSLAMQFGACSLQEVVEDAVEEMALLHPERFRVVLQGNVHGVWSYEELRRVVENLLSNAVKYGTPGTKITVTVDGRAPDRVELRVHNLGPAIPPDQGEKLFTPYGRTAQAVESGKHGWGIGLALTNAIVRAHHGAIRCESSPEHGTTFTADLPRNSRRAEQPRR